MGVSATVQVVLQGTVATFHGTCNCRDSIGAKKREALGKEGEEGARKKRRRGDSDDEYEGE